MKDGKQASGREKVALVIDDSQLLCRIVGRILVELGFHVIFAANGAEGCELARRYRPDLIFMDVEMPVMNGIEAASCLHDDPATRAIPLLFLSALDQAEVVRRASATGYRGILGKPLNKARLRAAVEQAMKQDATGAEDHPA